MFQGSSEGPIVNLAGQIIGLQFRSYGKPYFGQYIAQQGFGFAIPIDCVHEYIWKTLLTQK